MMRYDIKKGDLVRLRAGSLMWASIERPHQIETPMHAIVLGKGESAGWLQIFCDGGFYSVPESEIDKVQEPNYAYASC